MFETPKSFAPYHARDRAFFLVFAALAWIAVIMGFGPEVDGQLKGRAPFPPLIVHVHAFIFVCWLVLFTAQIWLISKRRPDIHRRLGAIAVVLVPVMVVLGVATTIVSRRLRFEAGVTEMLAFMIVPLTDMILFPSFAVPGLLRRTDSAAHKRLMLLATTMLLPAAYGRWIGPWINIHWGDGFLGFMAQSYLGPDMLILAAMLYDRITRGRVHLVYWLALPWILAVQLITSAIYHWPGWMPLAERIVGF